MLAHALQLLLRIVWSLTCLEIETRTYAATLMVVLLTVRARSASLLVLEAPPQHGPVGSDPTPLGVRALHSRAAEMPLALHSKSLAISEPRTPAWTKVHHVTRARLRSMMRLIVP
jgi:hypothetical protein